MNIYNVFRNPANYARALKLRLAGLYFDLFMKRFRAAGCSFAIPTGLTTRSGRGYFALDLYENTERQLVSEYIKGKERVLELGACIGVVSCIVNARLKEPEKHVVVEANPGLIPHLEQNRKLNNSSFSIFNGVISSSPEEIFYFGHSIVSGTLMEEANGALKTKVTGMTFADLEKRFGFSFDTLIMDIEGGEHKLLLENREKLGQFDTIILENHPHLLQAEDIKAYEEALTGLGFRRHKEVETSTVWLKS